MVGSYSSTTTHFATLLQSCIPNKALRAGKLLHAHLLRLGLSHDTFLSNLLIDFYSQCGATTSAHHVFDDLPHRDLCTWNSMLCAHARAGNLQNAHSLFAEMPQRNTVSWNTLITAFVRRGSQAKALAVYHEMVREGFVPTRFTLASVLSACGAVMDLDQGRGCHGLAVRIGLDNNLYVANALLCMYAKCRSMEDAVQAFWDVSQPNEVSFTTLMGGLAESNQVEEAVQVFSLMHRIGACIDPITLSSILGVFARASGSGGESRKWAKICCDVYGPQVHGLSIKLGHELDRHYCNSLLDMFAKNGDMDKAESVFGRMPAASVVSFNVMISGYGQKSQSEEALHYFKRMQYSGLEPDEITCINLLAACVKSGDIESGRQVFDTVQCPGLPLWNSMLSGYSQENNHEEAIKLFREMQFQSIQPDRTTLAVVLSSCTGLGLVECGKQIHAVSQKAGFHSDIYVGSGLVGLYSRCGKVGMAKHIFYRLPELDVVCWNSLIAGLSLGSHDMDALNLFKQMRVEGMRPTQSSYATVLCCCAKRCCISQGRQIQAQLVKDGCISDVFVGSALIDLYCKCGDASEALRCFDMMQEKSTVTWNQMIQGFAQSGFGEEAVCLYADMIGSGEKPDSITFVAVLTACNHAGLADRAIEIFDSMQHEHGIEPLVDHLTCVIDCLGRSGRFDEVELLLDLIPYKDDPVIWEVLLSSCRVHGNVRLARRAAEELFRLDPQNSVPYVLLANIYSSLGAWDEVRAIRKLMSDNHVTKDAGFSWLEKENDMEAR